MSTKRLTPVILALLFWAATACPASPAQLTSLDAVYRINNEEASHAIPVKLEATVTYFRPFEQTMFVQDGERAVFVEADTETKLVPGDRILVHGFTQSGLRPYVVSSDIVLLHHGTLPKAQPATFEELIAAKFDCQRVILRGIVRSDYGEQKTDTRGGGRQPQVAEQLQLLTNGGVVEVEINVNDGRGLKDLLDAEVEIAGVAGGKFDGKMEQTGVVIHVPSSDDVKVLTRAQGSSWSLPVTAMDQVLHTARVHDLTARVRVHGTITYYEPGSTVVLQDGSKSLWISTLTRDELSVGEVADAIGFPDAQDGFLRLNNAELQGRGLQVPIVPERVGWGELARSSKIFDLVSIDGQVVTENRETAQDEYVISSEGHLFTAIFRHGTIRHFVDEPIPPMAQMPIGSRVRVTGICIPQDSNPFKGRVPFDILLRSHHDIVMLVRPSLLNVRNLTLLAGVLLMAVFGVVARGWSLERRVRRETTLTATVEKWRSRVLEDINRARPLSEILAQITELLSYKLQGAPCWCEIADGTTLGAHPEKQAADRLLIISHDIPSHSGEALGAIYAGIDPRSKFRSAGPEALSNSAQLAALAIETGGLYSDLVHRSEFDLLTDIHNRFSLEKRLDTLITGARRQDEIFGLIYIDLDEFKQVNDRYGHGVGDLYLQEAALRMKNQLRPEDMLARLGGDEFAAVVSAVRSRIEVKEITRRLEACFDEVFVLDGRRIPGSASVGIAVYPQDGTTRDALLSTADAAMYKAKHRRHETAAPCAGKET